MDMSGPEPGGCGVFAEVVAEVGRREVTCPANGHTGPYSRVMLLTFRRWREMLACPSERCGEPCSEGPCAATVPACDRSSWRPMSGPTYARRGDHLQPDRGAADRAQRSPRGAVRVDGPGGAGADSDMDVLVSLAEDRPMYLSTWPCA